MSSRAERLGSNDVSCESAIKPPNVAPAVPFVYFVISATPPLFVQ